MNLNIYTTEMSKSIWDKSFFMDKVPGAKLIIDFGCADGAMVRMLAPLFPELTFYGYDINDELIDLAEKENYFHNVFFFREDESSDMIARSKEFKSEEICVNFSSVLHEVFSSTKDGIKVIQNIIYTLRPKFITIRDMYFESARKIIRTAESNSIIQQLNIEKHAIREFEDKYGTIQTLQNFIHFLIKYQWYENGWEKELEEDYFSWRLEDFTKIFDKKYSITFEAHYLLPYYIEQWNKLNMDMRFSTHVQFILRRS